MDLRRIRYTIALLCLVTTIVLITYKLSRTSKGEWVSIGVNTWSVVSNISYTTVKDSWFIVSSTTRADLSTTISSLSFANSKQLTQWLNPYLMIDNYYLIPLSTSVYGWVWTWIIKISESPLIVYYRYELLIGKWFTYLYELTSNSSRELGQLIMVGKVWKVFLFSIKESSDSYHGLSAIVDGSLTTLYTGDYTTAQYLWDTLKLNNSQEIYLPLSTSWF